MAAASRGTPDIGDLVATLSRGGPQAKARAAAELRTLATTEDSRHAILVAGAAPPLVALLADDAPDGKLRAAGALANLATTEAARTAIVAAGALPPFVALLHTGSPMAKEESISALRNIAASPKARRSIVAAGALPPLVALVVGGAPRVGQQAGAVGALANLADSIEVASEILAVGALPPIVAAMGAHEAKEVRAQAALAISRLAAARRGRGQVIEAGALPALAALLSDGDAAGKCHAAGALAILATEEKSVSAIYVKVEDIEDRADFLGSAPIVESGVLPALAALLGRKDKEHKEGREQAAYAFFNLAADASCRPAIIKAGALVPLVALLQSGGPEGKAWAAGALRHLADSMENREAIENVVPLVTVSGRQGLLKTLQSYCF